MGISIRADFDSNIDYASIRANGHEAVITAEQCGQIARLADELGITAHPAQNAEEEAFYGSYVPEIAFCLLPEEHQVKFRSILSGNAEALYILDQVNQHRIKASFRRYCGDRVYRICMVSEPADHIDVSLSGGNWKQFRNVIGINGDYPTSDIDCGELTVAELEQALDDSLAALIFAGAWHNQLAQALRSLIAYAKANNATKLIWA